MKTNNIKLSIVFSLFTLCASAQNYAFPTSNAIWTNVGSSYTLDQWNLPVWQTNWVDQYCANGVDTVINTTTYQKIDLCTASSSDYYGAIRYNAGTVHFVPKDSLNEYLLYDFTVSVGDTVNVIQNICDGWSSTCASTPNFSLNNIAINDIDTITVNGTQRRRINQFAGSNQWIEGIGSTAGLFMFFEENVSNYSYGLRCASENDTTVYDNTPLVNGTTGACNLSLTIDEAKPFSRIKIYPNPVNGNTMIINGTDPKDKIDIRVYDSNSIEVLHLSNIDNSPINITELSSGVYFIHITSEASFSIQKLIVLDN